MDWKDLPQEDKDVRLKKIGEALKFYDLETVSIKESMQIIYKLSEGGNKQEVANFSISGTVSISKQDKIEKFEKIIKEDALKGVAESSYEVEIDCKPIGEPMIPIKNVKNIRTGEDISINHKPGQVILIDFWATWCPPCQAPMAHNQEMLEHHGEKWGDNVRIIGISIDETAAAVVKHVDAKGWTKVEHYHRASSSSSKDYGVQGVPHVALVDTNGKLAFIGHPMEADIEKSIDSLLSGGKVLTKGESSDAAAAEDPSKIKAELTSFATEVGDKIKTNEVLKNHALMRDFVVVVSDSTYDINNNKMNTNCQNINVLVGPKVAVDAAKSEIEKILSSFTFKKEWRVQATD